MPKLSPAFLALPLALVLAACGSEPDPAANDADSFAARINKNAAPGATPLCYSILLAGGGVRGGLVHGASDRFAAYPVRDPVTPADLAATIYWRFGIDPSSEIHDLQGRPFVLSEGQPVRALFDG